MGKIEEEIKKEVENSEKIEVIREQLSGCSKGFAFILGMLYKSFDLIFGDWRTGGESFGEI